MELKPIILGLGESEKFHIFKQFEGLSMIAAYTVSLQCKMGMPSESSKCLNNINCRKWYALSELKDVGRP